MLSLTNKQKEFWNNCSHRWNVKSGATRSGKTFLDYYLIPKRIRAVSGKPGLYLILGNTKSTLQRNIIEPLQSIWGTGLVSDIKADNTAQMFGERIHCIGADKINQVNRIRGSSIKYCYGDEVVTWHRDVFDMLKSRLDKEYSCFDGTCNPDSPRHWFKGFIDSSDIDVFTQHYTIYDNPFNPPEFVRNLEIEYDGTVYFDRYILGKWVRAEGLVFPKFANTPERHFVSQKDVPNSFRWCEIGFDLGGNGSAYAMTCTAEGKDGVFYVLKSKKTQADKLNMEDIEDLVKAFGTDVESRYDVRIDSINCDHIAVIVNTIETNTKYRAELTYKPPLEGRPFLISKLLASGRLKFVDGQCDDLIDEMQNLVFDQKADRAIPLDDGSMQIDTWDSFVYSLAGNWNYLDF